MSTPLLRTGRSKARRFTLATALAGAMAFALLSAASALAAITPASNQPAGAAQIAEAIATTGFTNAAYYDVLPGETQNGTADSPLSSFPTAGGTFGILTTGNVEFADDPNTEDDTSANLDGFPVRGDTAFDITIVKVDLDVPAGANCLTLDFQFYSEEFPEYVNTEYNDAFIAELDSTTWTTSGSVISAPDNFAFDPSGDVISVNSSGNTSMNAANAAGTTYDGATPLLSASKQVSPGVHSLYLSIFDQGDHVLDSATFLDNVRVGFVPNPELNCVPGAQPVNFSLSLDPASAENPVGSSHTVTATLTDDDGDPAAGESVDFTVSGANAASGSATTDASGQTTFSYTGTSAGDDAIGACYDADDDGACEAVGSATKHWVAANTRLVAHPAIVEVAPGLRLRLAPSATLRTESNAPVAGKQIVFRLRNGNRICTAITGPNGLASCSGLAPLLGTVLSLGYFAQFEGDEDYGPARDDGRLIRVGGLEI
jgi:hypothetical protein